jgi:hypothetical protein
MISLPCFVSNNPPLVFWRSSSRRRLVRRRVFVA